MDERVTGKMLSDTIYSITDIKTQYNSEDNSMEKISVFGNDTNSEYSEGIEIFTNNSNDNEYLKKAKDLGLSGEQAEAYAKMLEANEINANIFKKNNIKEAPEYNYQSLNKNTNNDSLINEQFIDKNTTEVEKEEKSFDKNNQVNNSNQTKQKEKTMEEKIKDAKKIASLIKQEKIDFYEKVISDNKTKLVDIDNKLKDFNTKKPNISDYEYKDMYKTSLEIWEKKKIKLEEQKKKLETEIKEAQDNLNDYKVEKKKKNILTKFVSAMTFGLYQG